MKTQLLKAKQLYKNGWKAMSAKILRELFEISAKDSFKFAEELFS